MNKINKSLLSLAVLTTFYHCHSPSNYSFSNDYENSSQKLTSAKVSFDFQENGKDISASALTDLFSETPLQNLVFPGISDDLEKGLKRQLTVLKYRKNQEIRSFGKVDINTEKLERTIREILKLKDFDLPDFSNNLSAYQIEGEDGKGNVYFTGYYTPVLKVSKVKTDRFKYPLYARPDGSSGYPTRAQIDGEGVLEGQGLELAYTERLSDIYFMQVQGSGIVQYPDGSREMFGYASSNGHPYRSIGQYMIRKGYTTPDKVSLTWIKRYLANNPELEHEILFANSSYVFFERMKYQQTPKGAGLVPLTSDYSIAVDSRYIPLGSCLLAAVPIIKNNEVIRHDYRILIAQDKGGVIKGPGHVDLFSGIGVEGRKKATSLHHYGKMWLLLPKENTPVKKKELLAKL